jgi:GAF domain-containing protein
MVLRGDRVVYVSEGLATLCRRAAAELVGLSPLMLLAPDDVTRVLDLQVRRQRGEPIPAVLELGLVLPDGDRRLVECHLEEDGGELIIHARDLGAESARRALLEGLAEAGVAVRGEHSQEAVHARVQAELRRLGNACVMLRADGAAARVEWMSFPAPLRRDVVAATGQGVDALSAPLSDFGRRVLRDGAAFTDDFTGHAAAFFPPELAGDVRTRLQRAGYSRALGARIEGGPDAGLYLVILGAWHGDDVPAVRLFGAQVTAALDAARVIADLSRRNDDLGVLARVAALASEATGLAAFFTEAGRAIRPVVGCAGLAVFVASGPSGELDCVHADGASAALLAREPGSPAATALLTALRGRAGRILPSPAAAGAAPAGEALGAVALIPLVARSRAVGVLAAEFPGGVQDAERAVDLLTSAGAHFASAIESHHLVADLRRRVSELTLLVDVARASTQLDPVLLLEAGLRRICDTVRADGAVAYLRDGDRLILLSSTGIDADTARDLREAPRESGPAGRALATRAPVQARAAALGSSPPARTLAGEALGPCVAVPLLAKADAVGAMVLMRVAEEPFGHDEEDLLSSIGVQLGIAVDAARLFSDVRRRLSDLEAVHALAVRVFANAPGDAQALLQDGCREMVQALSARAVAVYLAADGVLRFAAGQGTPPTDIRQNLFEVRLADDPFSAEVIRSRAPLYTEDAARDRRAFLSSVPGVPPLSCLAVPLGSRGEVRGILYVMDRAGRRFSAADVALANAMAGALGIGVENAGLYAEARRRVEELSLMNEAGRTIARSLDLDEVLREAVAATQRLAGGRAWVLLYDGARAEVRLGAATAPVGGVHEAVAVSPGSLLARVLEGRRPVCEDLTASPEGEAHRAHHGGRSLLAVPVVLRGEPMGVLCVDEEVPRRFSDSDVQRVTAIADRLAVAVENARLYLETRRRAEEVELMHEVGRSLLQTLDIEQVLATGVRNLARIVDAPSAYLSFVTEDGHSLELRAAVGDDEARLGDRVPLTPHDQALATLVYSQREPIVVDDARTDPRVTALMRGRGRGTAYLGIPLVSRDQVIGAAVIVERRGPRRFTPADWERAAAVANQLAVAADNARLYERLRSSYAALERAQRQLLEGERLAALGELSAIVAHEVRNPLGVIFNSLGPLRRMLKPAGDARLLFNIVEEEADRLNRIVGDLLDFARPSTPELRPEDLGRVVEDAVTAALGQPDGAHVDLVTDLAPDLPPVTMDSRQIRQAVLNVAVNAVQAMPRGGRIALRTRRERGTALVEIEDTGGGIPEEVRQRIFEPFFTTKASGTGLGLAVVKRIVEGHGGTIAVHAAARGGTVFSLRLPLDPR